MPPLTLRMMAVSNFSLTRFLKLVSLSSVFFERNEVSPVFFGGADASADFLAGGGVLAGLLVRGARGAVLAAERFCFLAGIRREASRTEPEATSKYYMHNLNGLTDLNSKQPVACITQTRQDETALVQARVNCGGENLQPGEMFSHMADALRRSHQIHEPHLLDLGVVFAQKLHRGHGAAAGGQHRINQDDFALPQILRQTFVIELRC